MGEVFGSGEGFEEGFGGRISFTLEEAAELGQLGLEVGGEGGGAGAGLGLGGEVTDREEGIGVWDVGFGGGERWDWRAGRISGEMEGSFLQEASPQHDSGMEGRRVGV